MGMYKIVVPNTRMTSLLDTLEQIVNYANDVEDDVSSSKTTDAARRNYVKERRAMVNAAVDVKETPSSYEFVADVPGLGGDNVRVQVEDGNTLVISGKRRREASAEENGEQKQFKYLRMERRVGKFMRRFTLPEDAEMDKIGAQCQNGLLTVTVPKIPPQEPEKPKVIDIHVS